MNAIVFAPRTSPEIAARQLCAEMLRHGDTPMPDPAALARTPCPPACRAAENLIDNAATLYAGNLPATAADRDALRALITDARTNPPAPALAHPTRAPPRRRGPLPRTRRARPSLDVVARLDPRYRLRNVPRTRTRRCLLGCDRLSTVSCPVAAALSVEEDADMPAQMQTVAQVEFYWPGYDPPESD